jgi:MYXO-CTERM domain-containing protein
MRISISHTARCLPLLIAALWLVPRAATADVVPPPPSDCPDGTTPRTSHHGPYCEPPPPTECKPGYEPRVHLSDAYCEPPPALPCPEGSYWTSRSATNSWCQGGRSCEGDYPCAEGTTCVETALCVRQERQRRFMYEVVSGTCATDADCPEGETCATAPRCDPDVKRAPVAGEPAPEQTTEEPPAGTTDKPPVVGDGVEDVGGKADPDEVEPKGCAVAGTTASAAALAALGLVMAVLVRRRS